MRKMKLFMVPAVFICLVMLPSPSSAKDNKISLSFEGVSLGNVLKVLSRKTDRKFITDTELAGKRIVLHLSNVTPDEAIDALINTYDLYYVKQKDTNIYVIKSKDSKTVTTVSKIFYCNHANADKLQKVLEKKLTQGGNISADERTNSLIVTDMADNVDKIGQLIEELDTPTPQVLLEARILDVKLDRSLKTGIDITGLYKADNFWVNPLAKKRAEELDDDDILEESDIQPEYNYNQMASHSLESGGKLSFAVLKEGYNIEGLIEALKNDSDAKLLNNPKILVLNNQEATISIVDEGTIILNIVPEQNFRTGTSVSGIPVVNTSKVNTSFMLKDGETAVIGGLLREADSESEYKVPILGDIPVLGYFFKKYERTKNRTELTIFVTANIVKKTPVIEEKK